jgi:phosphoglycerate dehydrogenase-like enzyme
MPLLVIDGNAVSRTWTLTRDAEQRLRDEAPANWDLYFVHAQTSSDGDGPRGSSDEVMRVIPNADVYLGFGIPRPLYLAAKRLKWVHSAAAGVGNALYAEMVAGDVLLTNSAGVHAIPIAEYVVAAVLHFFRGLDIAVEQQHRREWSKDRFVGEGSPLREIGDARVLIVGSGGIGSETARRLAALGAHCIGVRRRITLGAPAGFADVIAFDAIDKELPAVDVVVLAAPLTDQTRGLLDARRLDLLRRSCVIVNVARGALLDEVALAERVRGGRLRGAVLDVFEREPLAADSPLWQLPNVVITPHTSAVTDRLGDHFVDFWAENIRRFADGRPLLGLVDRQAGY